MTRRSSLFRNGVPELAILRLLSEREMYGYELVAAIRSASSDAFRLGEGVVYPMLHALEADGLLRTRREEVAGRTRVYYRVTAKGRRRLAILRDEFHQVRDGVEAILGDLHHAT